MQSKPKPVQLPHTARFASFTNEAAGGTGATRAAAAMAAQQQTAAIGRNTSVTGRPNLLGGVN